MRRPSMLLLALLTACSAQDDPFSSAPPSLHVGEVALGAGEPGIAASVAKLQLQRDPANIDALLLGATAQAAMGQTEDAAAGFRKVLAARPGASGAALGLSRLITATDPASAEALLAPFAVRGEATPAMWNNLGVARDLLNRHAEAQDAYRHALAGDPAMQGAQVNLARSLSFPVIAMEQEIVAPPRPGRVAEAAPVTQDKPNPGTTQAESCDAMIPSVEPGLNSANPVVRWLYTAIGVDQTARRLADANLRCHPTSLAAHRASVYAEIDAGDFARALDVAFDAVRLAPNDAISYLMVADTERALGDNAGALSNLRKARSLLHP